MNVQGARPADVAGAQTLTPRRRLWQRRRRRMEAGGGKYTPLGYRSDVGGAVLNAALDLFGRLLALTPFFARGYRNAHSVTVEHLRLAFDHLPPAFDGYRILHLTDLHIDATPDLPAAIAKAVDGMSVDLCVMTGDYRFADAGEHRHILPALRAVLDGVDAQDGTVAVLGNHDDQAMAASLEDALGVTVLVNERIRLRRGGDSIAVSGTDDVSSYYTADAAETLEHPVDGFGLALVHSPEMADEAARGGHALYLCGHTHGGQIALPNGTPLITHVCRNRALAAGLWQRGGMVGYTGAGTGFSGLPIRFNTRGEATLITLRKGKDPDRA